MFPDPTIRWRPYESIIDGIERPPYVFDQGLWRGVLYLIVVAPNPSRRAYGIEMSCAIYAGFDEMIYSVANHGDSAGMYDGGIYIKVKFHTTKHRCHALRERQLMEIRR